MEQAGHGGLGRVEIAGDLGEGPALEMMHLDRPPLVLGECGERLDQPQGFLVADCPVAGRGVLARQPVAQSRGRIVESSLERPIPLRVALSRAPSRRRASARL